MSSGSTVRRVHLVAIGGTGMGSLACLLAEAGHVVSGSDHALYPPMSDILARAGIAVHEGFDPAHIPADADLVVIGNAVSRDNPEAVEAERRGVALASFPSALSELFLAERLPVVVTGTHGKTTTTSMTAWLLEAAGLAPGFLIGGSPANFELGARLGSGAPFVVEGDEYDTAYFDKGPKFLHYRPRVAIVGNVELDHTDIYADLEAILRAFERFVALVPSDGTLLLGAAEPHAARLRAAATCRVETVGRDSTATWRVSDERPGSGGSAFTLEVPGHGPVALELAMAGAHNVTNAAFACAASVRAGADPGCLAAGLAGFRGVKRRLQEVGEAAGVRVIDDFAHHPTAVRATLVALRQAYPGARVWVLFEPRSATSRRAVFQEAYARAFATADRVTIAPLFAPEKIAAADRLDVPRLVAEIVAAGGRATAPGDVEAIVAEVVADAGPGDVVAVLSSGGFGGIHRKLLDALGRR